MSLSSQLSLNMQLRDDATFNSFYVTTDNAQTFNAIKEFSQGIGEPFLYIFGGQGLGKTHLLQAACHHAAEIGIPAMYLPLQDVLEGSPTMLQDLEKIALVCLDDVQSIQGHAAWEEGLFHFFNRLRANNTKLLMAASQSPKQISIQLPDLKSRLAWGLAYQLQPLQDEQKLSALRLRATCRGLKLNKIVGRYLLSRCTRSMSELFNKLELLDRASLSEQRRLTVPFVKRILAL